MTLMSAVADTQRTTQQSVGDTLNLTALCSAVTGITVTLTGYRDCK